MLEFGIVNFWVYVLGAFAVIIAPGPNSLFVLKTAVTEGRRPALAGALAVHHLFLCGCGGHACGAP